MRKHHLIPLAALFLYASAVLPCGWPGATLSIAQAETFPKLIMNGQVLPAEPNAPYFMGGTGGETVFAPARLTLAKLGYALYWDEDQQEIVATAGDRTLRHTPGSNVWRMNDLIYRFDDGSQMIDGVCWVPVQPLSETLGWSAVWSALTETLYVKPGLATRIDQTLRSGTAVFAGSDANADSGRLLVDGVLWYEGGLTAGKPDGYGKLFEDGRLVYEGSFAGGQPDSTGTLYYPDGRRYTGAFRSGYQTGEGRLYDIAGHTLYSGEWVNGAMTGFGYLYNRTGAVIYSGSMRSNRREGEGVAFDETGNRVYSGQWQADQRSGQGKTYTASGKISYDGGWEKDKKNGSGRSYTLSSMSWYGSDEQKGYIEEKKDTTIIVEQEFVSDKLVKQGRTMAYTGDRTDEGLPNGIGAMYVQRGYNLHSVGLLNNYEKFYEGALKLGQMTGSGKLYGEKNVLLYDGELADGKREGRGKAFQDGRLVYEGYWSNDLEQGTGRRYTYESSFTDSSFKGHATLSMEEGAYKEGKLVEKLALYRFIGNFVNGVAEGYGSVLLMHDYKDSSGPQSLTNPSETGWPVYSGEFRNGLREGTGKLYESNRLIYEGQFRQGVREGYGKAYEANLNVYEGNFSGDSKNGSGVITNYFGKKLFEGQFVGGQKTGYGKEYDVSGYLIYEGDFKDNVRDGFGIEYIGNGSTVVYKGEFREGQRLDDYLRDHPND